MRKAYNLPELETILFPTEDVIVTSSLQNAGSGDGPSETLDSILGVNF